MSEPGGAAPEPAPEPAPESAAVKAPRVGALHRLRNWFLTGVIVTAPIGLTIYLTYAFVDWVDRMIGFLLPQQYHPETILRVNIPGFGLLVAIGSLTVIGFLTIHVAGHVLIGFGERMVERMPVIRGVYSALKQIFETVLAQSSTSFRQVALVQFPHPGVWAVAFVTGEWQGEISRKLGDEVIGLFVPTTPNPTSGYLVYAPRRTVVMLSMSVEDAMKLVISGGALQVPDRGMVNVAKGPPAKPR
jgi:uncharacterized membrane protein